MEALQVVRHGPPGESQVPPPLRRFGLDPLSRKVGEAVTRR